MSTVRRHFWQLTTRGAGGVRTPRKYGCSGTMPATVKRTVGSSWATSGALGSRWCPRSSKKWRKRSRISGLRTWYLWKGSRPVSPWRPPVGKSPGFYQRPTVPPGCPDNAASGWSVSDERSDRRRFGELRAPVLQGGALQARDVHLRHAPPLRHLRLGQLVQCG